MFAIRQTPASKNEQTKRSGVRGHLALPRSGTPEPRQRSAYGSLRRSIHGRRNEAACRHPEGRTIQGRPQEVGRSKKPATRRSGPGEQNVSDGDARVAAAKEAPAINGIDLLGSREKVHLLVLPRLRKQTY